MAHYLNMDLATFAGRVQKFDWLKDVAKRRDTPPFLRPEERRPFGSAEITKSTINGSDRVVWLYVDPSGGIARRVPLEEMIPRGTLREIGWGGMEEDDRATLACLIETNERDAYGEEPPRGGWNAAAVAAEAAVERRAGLRSRGRQDDDRRRPAAREATQTPPPSAERSAKRHRPPRSKSEDRERRQGTEEDEDEKDDEGRGRERTDRGGDGRQSRKRGLSKPPTPSRGSRRRGETPSVAPVPFQLLPPPTPTPTAFGRQQQLLADQSTLNETNRVLQV